MESLADAKKIYYAIGTAKSPALCGNIVLFSNIGFDHLLYKKRRSRTGEKRIKRFALLKYAKSIIESDWAIIFYRKRTRRGGVMHFWAFNATVEGRDIRVIVNRFNREEMQFLSIMEDYKKQKDPHGGLFAMPATS